ncbi:hypothetical protein V8G54_012258 [Vigna mungo]|uniref:Protein kinase domain-containing protein n=1 Tax=Vigna mungo TaxID=3915 RepID=A0AAQ3NTV9_VIGMU
MVVAVKKLKPEGFQGHKEWERIGYWSEFMPKGSLENHMFRRGPQPLSWSVRMKVAIGAVRGLCFLHNAKSQVIYRDFKASNILLDALRSTASSSFFFDFNAKLSDFGLAKAGPTDRTHVSTQVMGTQGYASLEYVATSMLYLNPVDWAKPYLSDKQILFRIMDTKLAGQY